jgi:hypothetical protein
LLHSVCKEITIRNSDPRQKSSQSDILAWTALLLGYFKSAYPKRYVVNCRFMNNLREFYARCLFFTQLPAVLFYLPGYFNFACLYCLSCGVGLCAKGLYLRVLCVADFRLIPVCLTTWPVTNYFQKPVFARCLGWVESGARSDGAEEAQPKPSSFMCWPPEHRRHFFTGHKYNDAPLHTWKSVNSPGLSRPEGRLLALSPSAASWMEAALISTTVSSTI